MLRWVIVLRAVSEQAGALNTTVSKGVVTMGSKTCSLHQVVVTMGAKAVSIYIWAPKSKKSSKG